MNRSRPRHRLRRSTRNALAMRPDQRGHRKANTRIRALLAGTVGLLLLSGTAVGLSHATASATPVPTAYTQGR